MARVRVDTLTIPAIPEYNGTEVVCVANCNFNICTYMHIIHTLEFYFYRLISLAIVTQALGLDATFLCQHPTDSGTIEWIINGTRFRGASSNGMIVIEGRGNATEGLKIRALPQFNGTELVCVLYIIEPNGTVTVDRSTPATLTVQGTEIIHPSAIQPKHND